MATRVRIQPGLVRRFFVLITLFATTSAWGAEARVIKAADCAGTVTVLDVGIQVDLTTEVDMDFEAVRSVFSDYGKIDRFLGHSVRYELRKRRKNGARLFREIETPIFMPNFDVVVDVRLTPGEQEHVVDIKLIEGSPKKMLGKVTIKRREDGWTTIRYESVMAPPIELPSFMKAHVADDRPAEVVAAVLDVTGAEHARRPQLDLRVGRTKSTTERTGKRIDYISPGIKAPRPSPR